MNEAAIDKIELVELARAVFNCCGDARVNNEIEGHEVCPLRKDQKQKDAVKVHVSELINPEVNNKHSLKQPETLHLGPLVDDLIVANDTYDHKVDHCQDLDSNPDAHNNFIDSQLIIFNFHLHFLSLFNNSQLLFSHFSR